MNMTKIIILFALLSAGAWFARDLIGGDDVPVADTPTTRIASELSLIEAIPFRLTKPMVHTWRSETPSFTEGVLAVIEGDRELLAARQAAGPLLMWGAEIPQILNNGAHHGHVVVVLPLTDHQSARDLAAAPLFFGPRVLAETMDRAAARGAADRAIKEGAAPIAENELPTFDSVITLDDEIALYRRAADLVTRFSPSETDCAAWLRGDAR